MSANDSQVGGTHYARHAIQPWDFIAALGLDWFQGSVVKYVVRYRDKGGAEDLRKARHILDKMIELAEAEERRRAAGAVSGMGWRWLTDGDVIRAGDVLWEAGRDGGAWVPVRVTDVGVQYDTGRHVVMRRY